jgi:cytochrome c-type biogenesis protein
MCVALAATAPGLAQRMALGSPMPASVARDLQGVERALQDLAGPRGLVIVFWAGWSERALEELRRLEGMQRDMRDRGVGLVAVNVDRQNMSRQEVARVRELVGTLGLTMPVLVDDGLKLFHAYGVMTVPSTVVVNAKGEVDYFLAGYPLEQRHELASAIERMAGIAHDRPVVDVPRAAPAALRRFQFGRVQLAGGRVAAARATFEAAAAADPNFPDPLVELAALALDEGETLRARELLDRALALNPEHAGARAEGARAQFLEGRADEARQALEPLVARERGAAVAQAYPGFVLLTLGRTEAGAAALTRATEAGGPESAGPGAPGPLAPAQAAAAMTRYRRAMAARGR